MTLTERLADAKARSVTLYLQRATLGQQQQQIATQVSILEQGMLRIDGEIDLLEALIAEASKVTPVG